MTAATDSCIFCRIVRHQAPASVVAEDEQALAFLDIRPINPGHVLVIPKAHAASLAGLSSDLGTAVFKMGVAVAAALRRSGLRCEGVNLLLADGEAAGQEVFHVHLHVIPRYRGDGFGLRTGPQHGRIADRAELDETAEKIRAAIRRQ